MVSRIPRMQLLVWCCFSPSLLFLLFLSQCYGGKHGWRMIGFSFIHPAAAFIPQANQKANAECGWWKNNPSLVVILLLVDQSSNQPTNNSAEPHLSRSTNSRWNCHPHRHGGNRAAVVLEMNIQPETSIIRPFWKPWRPNIMLSHKRSANMVLG